MSTKEKTIDANTKLHTLIVINIFQKISAINILQKIWAGAISKKNL